MDKLKILEFPDKRLRRVSEAIAVFDQDLKKLSANMLVTMYEKRGIGLAAPQVGESIRLFIIDTSPFLDMDDEKIQGHDSKQGGNDQQ